MNQIVKILNQVGSKWLITLEMTEDQLTLFMIFLDEFKEKYNGSKI